MGRQRKLGSGLLATQLQEGLSKVCFYKASARKRELHQLRACSQPVLISEDQKAPLMGFTGYSLVGLEDQRALLGPAPTWREGKQEV